VFAGGEVNMGKMRIESCPRCGKGDISLDKDHYGWYQYCLQCGYMRDMANMDSELAGRGSHLKHSWHSTKLSGGGQKVI
jgi:ssDNA-binding Zn-finger/Zn-ribbon topoisomerase 1